MVRTSIAFGEAVYLLAQAPDFADLKAKITAAARAGGEFVDFVVVGNRTVSVLVTGRDRVVLSEETIPFDPRDTGDTSYPFGTFFDEI
jgi:regulator of extracellular matrix RemA (YlzA/DUF370 family)